MIKEGIKRNRYCGECKYFLDEDECGYGYCKMFDEERKCNRLCKNYYRI